MSTVSSNRAATGVLALAVITVALGWPGVSGQLRYAGSPAIASFMAVIPFLLQAAYVGWLLGVRRLRQEAARDDALWLSVVGLSAIIGAQRHVVPETATAWAHAVANAPIHPIATAIACMALHFALILRGRARHDATLR